MHFPISEVKFYLLKSNPICVGVGKIANLHIKGKLVEKKSCLRKRDQ